MKNIQRAMLEKYQVAHAFHRQEFKEKYISTCLSRYGVMNAGGAPAVQEKIHCHYFYDNKSFDSAPEIAFYVWLSDNAVKFEYQPADFFEYVHDGKAFKYFPDFKVWENDVRFKYVELKGDHFLAEDGTWRNPFRNQDWSDADYARECAKYEAKRKCCLQNDVEIMYSADYGKYVDYAVRKFGPNWWQKLKTKKQNAP